MNKTLSISECAERLGLTRQAVFYRIKKKTIDANQGEGGRWEVVDNEKVAEPLSNESPSEGIRSDEIHQTTSHVSSEDMLAVNQNLLKKVESLEKRLNEMTMKNDEESLRYKYLMLAVVSAITLGISSILLYFLLSHFDSHEVHHRHETGGQQTSLP